MTAGSVIKLVLAVVIVSSLVGLLAGVDFAEVVEELSSADLSLLLLGLLVAPLAQVFFSFSTLGASLKRLPFLPVLMLQYAIQFIALVLPATAARIALQIRFFERLGVSYGAATSMGAIDGFGGFVVQVLLLVLIAASSLPGFTTDVDTGSDSGGDDSSDPSLVAMAVLIGLIWTVVTLVSPRRRARVRRAVPQFIAQMRDQASQARSSLNVLRHPSKVMGILGGNLGGQVVQADRPGHLPGCVRGVGLAVPADPGQHVRQPVRRPAPRPRRGRRGRGRLHLRAAGHRRAQRDRGLHRHRVPPRHLLPAPAVVLPGHVVAAPERLRLTDGRERRGRVTVPGE